MGALMPVMLVRVAQVWKSVVYSMRFTFPRWPGMVKRKPAEVRRTSVIFGGGARTASMMVRQPAICVLKSVVPPPFSTAFIRISRYWRLGLLEMQLIAINKGRGSGLLAEGDAKRLRTMCVAAAVYSLPQVVTL